MKWTYNICANIYDVLLHTSTRNGNVNAKKKEKENKNKARITNCAILRPLRITLLGQQDLTGSRKTETPMAELCVKTLRSRLSSPDGDLYGIYGEVMEAIELNSAGELG